MSRVTSIVALVLVAFPIAAAASSAARPPSRAERATITSTIRAYVKSLKGAPPIARIGITRVRVSTVNQHWAAALVATWGTSGIAFQPQQFVLLRTRLTGPWRVRTYGTDEVGCVLPKAVQTDLAIGC